MLVSDFLLNELQHFHSAAQTRVKTLEITKFQWVAIYFKQKNAQKQHAMKKTRQNLNWGISETDIVLIWTFLLLLNPVPIPF